MFDSSARLVIVQPALSRYVSPIAAVVKPGCTLSELLVTASRPVCSLPTIPSSTSANCWRLQARDERKKSNGAARWDASFRLPTSRLQAAMGRHPRRRYRHGQSRKCERGTTASTRRRPQQYVQGLALFDASAKLVICNQRYLNMYRLPPEIVKPGCPFHDIIAWRIKNDSFFTADIETFISDLRDKLDRGTTVRKYATLRDGRIISIVDHPTTDGGWVTTHEDVTELRRAEERISYAAHHDALTDLANRTRFREKLDQALKRVGRGEHFAVLYLDLDNFKIINDTLGHLGGDELLKEVAGRLQSCVRNLDTLARLGGDEFGIIQATVKRPPDVANLAMRIQEALKEPYDIGGHRFIVGTSIGVAMSPDNGVEAEQLLKNADLAMYQAKANGRGTFCFFEPEMDARVKARSALELSCVRRSCAINSSFTISRSSIFEMARSPVSRRLCAGTIPNEA